MIELEFEPGLSEVELTLLIVASGIMATRQLVYGRKSALENTKRS